MMRDQYRTTGRLLAARPCPAGLGGTARPASARPMSLAVCVLHNSARSAERRGRRKHRGSSAPARLPCVPRRGNDRRSVGTTAGRRVAVVVMMTATSERPVQRGHRGLTRGCRSARGSSSSSLAAAMHLVTQEVIALVDDDGRGPRGRSCPGHIPDNCPSSSHTQNALAVITRQRHHSRLRDGDRLHGEHPCQRRT